MSVHGLFMLLLASSGAAAAIVVGPLLALQRPREMFDFRLLLEVERTSGGQPLMSTRSN